MNIEKGEAGLPPEESESQNKEIRRETEKVIEDMRFILGRFAFDDDRESMDTVLGEMGSLCFDPSTGGEVDERTTQQNTEDPFGDGEYESTMPIKTAFGLFIEKYLFGSRDNIQRAIQNRTIQLLKPHELAHIDESFRYLTEPPYDSGWRDNAVLADAIFKRGDYDIISASKGSLAKHSPEIAQQVDEDFTTLTSMERDFAFLLHDFVSVMKEYDKKGDLREAVDKAISSLEREDPREAEAVDVRRKPLTALREWLSIKEI